MFVEATQMILSTIEIIALFLIVGAIMDLIKLLEGWDPKTWKLDKKSESDKEITDFMFDQEA